MMISDLILLLNKYALHGDMEIKVYDCQAEQMLEIRRAGIDMRDTDNGPILLAVNGPHFPCDLETDD
jgi:hypothetical protein